MTEKSAIKRSRSTDGDFSTECVWLSLSNGFSRRVAEWPGAAGWLTGAVSGRYNVLALKPCCQGVGVGVAVWGKEDQEWEGRRRQCVNMDI